MPLGSALKSTIDIDFTRAQGINSSGSITFQPPRIRVGTTMVSPIKVRVPVINGLATVQLVRLVSGTYHVREEIDGQGPYEFNFALPVGSAETIQYEEIAPVDPVPLVYTVLRTINGMSPDPVTGNIELALGGDPIALNDLTDVIVDTPLHGHALMYDTAESRWENRFITPIEIGASASGHTHTIEIDVSDVTGLQAALDAKAQASHSHTVEQITGFETAVENIAELIADVVAQDRAFPNRIVRVKDKSKQGAGDTYNLPNTASAWVLFAVGPSEYTIQANVDDDISLEYDFLMDRHVTAKFDFAVVTGSTPTIQRYLSSGSSTPSADGVCGSYPSNETFQGVNGTTGFTVQSADLDSGFVRLRWVIKTSIDTGKIYANNNYPLTIRVVNTRLSGL
jgi:hypothetical protein